MGDINDNLVRGAPSHWLQSQNSVRQPVFVQLAAKVNIVYMIYYCEILEKVLQNIYHHITNNFVFFQQN